MINIAICKNRKDKTYINKELEFKELVKILRNTTRTNETYEEYLNQYQDYTDKTSWPTSSRVKKLPNNLDKKQHPP